MAKVFEVDEEKGKYNDEKEGAKMSPPTDTLQARGGQMCHIPGGIKKKRMAIWTQVMYWKTSYNSANKEGACVGTLHVRRDVMAL